MTTKSAYFPALLLTLLPFVASQRLYGQLTPHPSEDCIAVAASAASSIVPDGILVMIGAEGDTVFNGAQLRIDQSNGDAAAWGFFYYSPATRQWSAIGVVDILGSGLQAGPIDLPVAIPASLTRRIDTALPFSPSSAFATALQKNTTLIRYQATHPAAEPDQIGYRQPLATDSLALPAGFPLDSPVWGIRFPGTGDTAMQCWVSARTGESFCQQGSSASSSVDARQEEARAEFLTAVPNPGGDLIRVVAVPPATAPMASGSTTFSLYNIAGDNVLEPNSVTSEGGRAIATFDLKPLPPGAYICRISGMNWEDAIKIEH